jgi:hypothetical protein
MRHLRAAGDPALPLVVVGHSTGAALALQHQLAALDDPDLPRADRLVLLSPLVGLTRGAGLAPLLSALDGVPGFEKAAWLDVLPEFNPFKYNSFPVNGGWQSYRLAAEVVGRLERARAAGSLARLPPILGFHSVLDTTVRSDAVVRRLYDALPANGSELVLYDLNRWNVFQPLFRPAQLDGVRALFDGGPRDYTLRVVTNRDPGTREVHEIGVAPGAGCRGAVGRWRRRALGWLAGAAIPRRSCGPHAIRPEASGGSCHAHPLAHPVRPVRLAARRPRVQPGRRGAALPLRQLRHGRGRRPYLVRARARQRPRGRGDRRHHRRRDR